MNISWWQMPLLGYFEYAEKEVIFMPHYIMPSCGSHGRGRCEDGVYEFLSSVELESSGMACIRIFAVTGYKLFVNGKYVCEGPCRSSADTAYFDTVKTDAFKKGKNEIKAVVFHISEPLSFTTGKKSTKPVLLMEGKIECDSDSDSDTKNGSARFGFETNSSWCCRRVKNHRLLGDDVFLFPYESISGDAEYEEIKLETGDEFDFDKGYSAAYGSVGFRLFPRPIPMLAPAPGEEVTFREVRRGDGFIELDAGKYVTAKVSVTLADNCRAKVIYAECYEFDEGRRKRLRDDTSGIIRGVYDEILSGKSEYTFESFWFRAFRFIRIETDGAAGKILKVGARRYNYPVHLDGSFSCSDETYNKMNEISINTMLCCTSDLFVDCPYYEQQQYIMDTAIEAAVFMRMTSDTAMVRKCISEFAASAQPNGLLCANYPASYVQIIPGFSFFWISLLGDYLDYSADTNFVRRFIPTIDGILTYFDSAKNSDGLALGSREWDFLDWVQGWERGKAPVPDGKPLAVYSMMHAYALKRAGYIAEKCGRKGIAEEYGERYDALCRAINKAFYVPEREMYHDGNGTFSMHTIIWAILSGTVAGARALALAEKLCDPSISKSSYSMNYFLFRALEECGIYDAAPKYFDGWKTMIDLHCTTWCENPDDPRSECHAWSSAPLYEFSACVLGVKYSFDDEIVIKPHTLGLSEAHGSVPTRFGTVKIKWTNKNGDFHITVESTADIVKKLTLPDGKYAEFTDSLKSF